MKKQKISGVLIYLFAFALVLVLYFYYVFTPLTIKAAKLDAEHLQNTAQIEMYEQQIEKTDELKNKISELQSELDSLNQSEVVNGKNAAEDIGAAYKTAGITPAGIQVGDEVIDKTHTATDGRTLCSVSVNLTAQCDSAQLQKLLDYFEKQSKGAYYVNTVALTQQQDKTEASLTLTLYYFASEGTKG